MPASDFKDALKQQADIVRIVGDYVKLKKAGAQNFSGLCPFHNEKTPSFSVHATRQFFHCFGCGVSGDVFSFVQKIENITFPEAMRSFASRASCGLENSSLGMGTPSFCAIRRTASGKVMFSIFCTNEKTSPETPQPKQWKN